MSEHRNQVDRAIDEALRALTDGPPANGLRKRVLTRIAAGAEPTTSGQFGAFIWDAHRLRPASVIGLAVLALTAALLVSTGLQQRPARVIDTATISIPAEQIRRAPVIAGPVVQTVEPVGTLTATTMARPRLAAPPRDSLVAAAGVAGEDASPDPAFSIVLLRDPTPVVDRPLEIAPVVIEPIANREIQIPFIEPDRPPKAPGPTDKR